jgi:FkbM family methyltransferase
MDAYTWEKYEGMTIRRDLAHDRDIVNNVLIHDEYQLARLNIQHIEELVVDLGAHIGCFAKLYHKYNPYATIICVEANPANIALLYENVGSFARVVCGACYYSGRGLVALVDYVSFTTEVLRALPCVVAGQPHGDPRIQVATLTLEQITNGHPLDVLKIDVEGAEFNIFQNAKVWPRRLVIGEFHDHRDTWDNLRRSKFPGWRYSEVDCHHVVFHLEAPCPTV